MGEHPKTRSTRGGYLVGFPVSLVAGLIPGAGETSILVWINLSCASLHAVVMREGKGNSVISIRVIADSFMFFCSRIKLRAYVMASVLISITLTLELLVGKK